MSENRDTRAIFSASRVTLICRSRHMFLQSAFPSSFLSSKPCLFPLESTLEFVIHRGKPKFISLPVKFPPDRSKFQFFSMARSNDNFHANFAAVFVLFFLHPTAKIMLSMLFNTLLKITTHNT